MQEIVQLITNIGFPIAACIYMALYVRDLNQKHTEEIGKMTEAINNNTLALERLSGKLKEDD